MRSGEKASAAELYREESLILGRIIERLAYDTGEGAELKGVEVVVAGREGERVTST